MPRAEKDPEFLMIRDAAEEQGWTIDKTSKGHWKFLPPTRTGRPCFFSGSPSDFRAMRNFIAALRRNGFRPPAKMRGRQRRSGRKV